MIKKNNKTFKKSYKLEEGMLVMYQTIEALYHYYEDIFPKNIQKDIIEVMEKLEDCIMPNEMCINGFDFYNTELFRKITYIKEDCD